MIDTVKPGLVKIVGIRASWQRHARTLRETATVSGRPLVEVEVERDGKWDLRLHGGLSCRPE
jgi:hypothetical protein